RTGRRASRPEPGSSPTATLRTRTSSAETRPRPSWQPYPEPAGSARRENSGRPPVPEHYAVWLDRDGIFARGPEAAAYLQGQLSQDVVAMRDDFSAWSWVLSPQGKVDALVRVTRRSEDDWLLDTDAGWGEALVMRLKRFKLRTK